MKKVLIVVVACFAAVIMTGCMSTHTNDATTEVKFNVKAKEYQADVVTGKQAVSGDASVHSLFGIISWGVSKYADNAFVTTSALPLQLTVDPLTVAKQGATYNACEANKADAILAAKYQIEVADYFVYKVIKAKVTGYPATIKGVK